MNKIRVLHMVREMEIGGIQTLIMNIYENLDRNKVQFDFLVNSKGIYDEKILKMGGKIYYIPYIKDVGPIKYQKNLRAFLKQHPEYKILHSHFDQFTGLIAKEAFKCNMKTIIAHSHIISNSTSFLGKIYKSFLKKDIFKYATDYFACSDVAAKYLFGNNSNVKIIRNGIDIEKFKFNENKRKEIREKLNIKDDCIVIGHTGRIVSEKNHLFLLKIFIQYLQLNPNSKLLLVGDGNLKNLLEIKVKEKGLESKVIFLGNKKNVYDYYNAMDYFVFPSLYEGLGISLIEAQANGIPCFASETVSKETNITNEVRYISLSKNAEFWAQEIFKIPRYRYEKTKEIIESGYDIESVSKYLEEFYLEKNKEV